MSFENGFPTSHGLPSTKAMMQKANEMTAIYFAASIIALSALMAIAHFASVVLTNSNPDSRGLLPSGFIKIARFVHVFVLWDLTN
jgi:hypothetical protein